MITILGLFIVVTSVEQQLLVLPNTTGKRSYVVPTLVFKLHHYSLKYALHIHEVIYEGVF